MGTTDHGAGTPFPSRRKRDAERVAHPEDIYDLALAGARFVLDRGDHDHATDRAREEIATTARSLSARKALRLSPVWTQAATHLIRNERITAEDLDAVVKERKTDESFAQLLLRKTSIPEGTVADAIARGTSSPLIQLTTYPVHGEPFSSAEEAIAAPKHAVLVDELAARLIPRELQQKHDMILVAAWEGEGVIAMVDPGDESAVWEAQEATGLRLTRFTALASQLRLAVERCAQPRPDVDVPATGRPHDAVPFLTAIGIPALVLVATFLFVFRDSLNLRHHFALISLAIGIFFFTYALRYYLTTAAVIGVVLFGDRLRRERILSSIRAAKDADPRAMSLAALAASGDAAHQNYRTLRGEQLDEIGAIIADTERIGAHRLPREQQPFVSIQLAMYNERHVVDRLLRACTSFDYDNYEVIVADDSTDPQALAILDKWSSHPRVRILHRGTRKGFKGGALQEALKRMDERTEYVMIFDSDFIPPADAIWHFLDYFGRLPGPNGEMPYGHTDGLRGVAEGVPTNGDRLAAVQGYQWHMLNASENWITKGIRTEFSGSYVLERAAQELFGTMKMISGSVYMIRADVLRRLGWSTSITEDWELTIRLYLAGYKVLYTPYVQAPSECVSKLGQLIRQRKRWARGHTFNVKKYFFAVLRSRNMNWREKFEFLYYAPYYLQSILFLAGTVSWVLGIFLLNQRLPLWGETLGWSLVVSNVLALPLMNLAGLILEGSVKRDIVGLGSFIGLSTLLVPFQGWAALRGLLEPTEGGWDRTPKSGRITESIGGLKLRKVIPWELPSRRKLSSRAAHIVVTCVAGAIAGAILGVGALSMRAAASSGKVSEGDLVLPFVFGTLIPLAVVGYAWLRMNRRIAVCVLAAAVGLSSNVVFLAATVPANATAGLTSTFMFRNASAFQSPHKDMEQGYTPGGAASQTPGTNSNNWVQTFASDTFTSTMSMNAGSATVDLYGENTAGNAPAFRNASSAWSGGISYVGAGAQDFGTTGNLSAPLPTGWAADDFAVLVVAGRNDDATEPTVTNWTKRSSHHREIGAVDLKIITYYRVLQSGDTDPSVAVGGWDDGMSAQILVWRGVDTTTPFDVADQTGDSGGTADPWTGVPAITTVTDMSWVVSAVASSDDNAIAVGTANGFTSPARIGGTAYDTNTGADHAVAATDYLKAVPGATTMLTWDATANGADNWAGITFALRPAQYLTIAKPTGVAQNDVMIAAIAARSTNVTVSAPSGWSGPIRTTTQSTGTAHIMWTFYKVAGSSEGASYTFTVTDYHSVVGGIQAFSGVDTATLTSLLENGQATASSTTHATPALTTTRPNAMIVTHHATSSQNATWTQPTGMNDAYDTPGGTGTGHMTMQASYVTQAAATGTGTKTATSTGTNTGTTHILALYPTVNSCTVTATLKHVVPSTTISLIGATQNSLPTGGGTLSLSVPGSTVDNDVMVAVVAVRPDTATITAPGGWTPVPNPPAAQTSATQHKVAMYYRVAASEPAAYDWTIGATSTGASGGIMTFSGVSTSSPVNIDQGQLTVSGLSHATPNVTTTVVDTMVVATFVFSSSATWTEGSGMFEAIDVMSEAQGATGISVATYYKLQTSAGATGAKTGTANNDADVGSTHILALRPASVGSQTTLGSGTGSFSSATATLTQITFATSAVSAFADGDRLHVDVSVPNDATNCSARLHYDGSSAQSKLVTATIVPEGILGLLLIAPFLPIAIRRRWIPVPGMRR